MTDATYKVDKALKARIRRRIGRDNATIEIREETFDPGFCETCSYPEDGFSVYADGDLVWPSDDYLKEFGGVVYADTAGYLDGNRLSAFGQFDAWLNGREWDNDD